MCGVLCVLCVLCEVKPRQVTCHTLPNSSQRKLANRRFVVEVIMTSDDGTLKDIWEAELKKLGKWQNYRFGIVMVRFGLNFTTQQPSIAPNTQHPTPTAHTAGGSTKPRRCAATRAGRPDIGQRDLCLPCPRTWSSPRERHHPRRLQGNRWEDALNPTLTLTLAHTQRHYPYSD